MADLVQTSNGTFITREQAEAAGLPIPGRVARARQSDKTDEDEAGEYETQTVVELRDELRLRDLPTSGSKAELIARLVEDDEKGEEA